MSAFAIQDLKTGLYWTGLKRCPWGSLKDAKEWSHETNAARTARQIGASQVAGGSEKSVLAVVQTV